MTTPLSHLIKVPQLRYHLPESMSAEMVRMTIHVERTLLAHPKLSHVSVLPPPVVEEVTVEVPSSVVVPSPKGHLPERRLRQRQIPTPA